MGHTEEAKAVANQTGWNIDAFATERGWEGVGIGPVGRHRDSDSLAKSNFRVVFADLCRILGDAVEDVRFRHWGVGWIEEIAFDAGNAKAVEAVQAWEDRLADYPVADEEDFSTLEWYDNHPSSNECYSEAGEDCACGIQAAKKLEKECLHLYESVGPSAVYSYILSKHPSVPWAHCPPCEDTVPTSRGDCLVCGSIIPSPSVTASE